MPQRWETLNTQQGALLVATDGWQTLTLAGGWSANATYGTPAVHRNAFGLVFLRGLVTGTANTTICTLPPEFRPEFNEQFMEVDITTAGVVKGLFATVRLSGVVFRVAR
jgi:hypothetical protein